jgi:hypothetical protein
MHFFVSGGCCSEAFQRPPLHEASVVLAQVMASAPSERLDTYTDMGCHHVHSDHSVVIKCECFCSCCLFYTMSVTTQYH